MHPVRLAEVEKLRFVNAVALRGRFLASMCYWDGSEWEFWFPKTDGELLRLQVKPADSDYWAAAPEAVTDASFAFFNNICQLATFRGVETPVFSIRNDLHNLFATFWQLDIVTQAGLGADGTRLFTNNLELFIIRIRGLFDHLQETLATIWGSVSLIAPDLKKKNLPKRYVKMLSNGDSRLSVGEISAKHGVPNQLATAYDSTYEYFLALRTLRDRIIHGSLSRSPIILVLGDGPAIKVESLPDPLVSDWPDSCYVPANPNRLLSLKTFLATMLHQTIQIMDHFSEQLVQCIQFGEPMSPGNLFFNRGPALGYALPYLNDPYAHPWFEYENSKLKNPAADRP